MYMGVFNPDGTLPKTGKSRSQDAEVYVTNMDTEYMFRRRLMSMAMSVYEWTGLPEGVDARMLEFWLLRDGYVGFFYDKTLKDDPANRAPEGYAVLQLVLSGDFDIYEYPRERRAYAVNGFNYRCDETDSVIIFDNCLRSTVMDTVLQYAHRLADVQRSIDINVHQQRAARIITCDERQRLSMLNALSDIEVGKPWITADRSFEKGNFDVIDNTSPYIADKLQIYKHQLWNEALTALGIENVNTDKRERLVSDEVSRNMGDVEAERWTRLNSRKQACEEINELFGLSVDVRFRGEGVIEDEQVHDAAALSGGDEIAGEGEEGGR